MKKKVLIITYYWPPAGGPGVQRWLKFVKYLPDFDIEPIVVIPENPYYPIKDQQLCDEVSEQLKIIKIPTKEPYKWAQLFFKKKTKTLSKGIISQQKNQSFLEKILLSIRGNFFIPDARKSWVNPVVEGVANYIKKNEIETVITTGPPHSVHLIGLALKEQLNIKWFADFRDPWTTIGYHDKLYLLPFAQKKHKKLEQQVLKNADEIIVTSPTTKKDFLNLTDNQNIHLITNGYDIETVTKKALDTKFSLAHIGSLLSERNPVILWKVLSDFVKENQSFAQDFELKLIGTVSDDVLKSIKDFGLESYISNVGYLSHKEAIIEQRRSQVLLLIEINSLQTQSIIPGKLFEYMAAERPIIAIVPENSDIETIITQTNSGVVCKYTEEQKLKETLQTYYDAYQKDSLKVASIGLQYYSRKKLTEKLAEILKK